MLTRLLMPRCAGLVAALALTGCGDDITLPPANVPIASQQITVYALTGTAVTLPSAYSIISLTEVRTDQSSDFDFGFEIGPRDQVGAGTGTDTVAVLTPRAWFGFTPDGGFLPAPGVWDSLRLAPAGGYDEEQPVVIVQGSQYFVTSRRQTCNFGLVRPRYAKLQVEQLDLVERKAVIRLVIDPNCGYRGLGTGFPTE